MDELMAVWHSEVIDKGGVVNVLLMKDVEGQIHYLSLFLMIFWPISSVYIFVQIIRSYCGEYTAPAPELDSNGKEIKEPTNEERMIEWLQAHPALKPRKRSWDS